MKLNLMYPSLSRVHCAIEWVDVWYLLHKYNKPLLISKPPYDQTFHISMSRHHRKSKENQSRWFQAYFCIQQIGLIKALSRHRWSMQLIDLDSDLIVDGLILKELRISNGDEMEYGLHAKLKIPIPQLLLMVSMHSLQLWTCCLLEWILSNPEGSFLRNRL